MKRIQLSRAKGWRMPSGAVKIDRTSVWGNPYRVVPDATNPERFIVRNDAEPGKDCRFRSRTAAVAHAIAKFRAYAIGRMAREPDWLAPLRGKDLACWCKLCPRHRSAGKPLNEPCPDCDSCHADALMELANEPTAKQWALGKPGGA